MSVVLALRALGLGDALTTVPALRSLRTVWPGRRIILAGPAHIGSWLAAIGVIDEALAVAGLDDDGMLRRLAVAPEATVNLHGRGPESHRLLRRAGGDVHLAYRCPAAEHRAGPAWEPDEHEVDRWLRLVASAGGRGAPDDLRLASPGPRREHVVIHPGAAHSSRRWPLERWTAVARALTADGRHVIVTGGPGERALCHRISARVSVESRAGQEDLSSLAHTVGTAALLLSADTGVAHLATAFGTPSVTLFGPVSPSLWGPRIDPEIHVALWTGRPSDPRPGNALGTALDERLAEIGVDEVLDAALSLLRRAPHTESTGPESPSGRPAQPTVSSSRTTAS